MNIKRGMMIMSFELYIDIDQDFDRFLESKTWGFIKSNWKYIEEFKLYPELYYRRSSSGHVHLKLEFLTEPDILVQFEIRALMHDDPFRIALDLRRLPIQGKDEINRIFSSKYKNGQLNSVGKWIKLDVKK